MIFLVFLIESAVLFELISRHVLFFFFFPLNLLSVDFFIFFFSKTHSWMEEDAACPAVLTDGDMVYETSSRIETKRSHEFVVDSTDEESLPNKKQALEALNSEAVPEASDENISTLEDASTCQTISSQLMDCSSRPEMTSCSCGDVPSVSAGNSSTQSTGSKGPSREGSSIDLPTSQKSTGIRKLKIIFGKSRGLGNSIAASTGQNASIESDNGPSYGGFCKDPKTRISGAQRSNGSKKADSIADLGTAAQVGISGAGNFRSYHLKEKMELKMSKKVVPSEFPSSVKRLLSSGLLEGVHVKYISWVHKVSISSF